ncbi:MAG: glycosyltransferase [Methanobacteriota archaeon]|nr:MAG: glycosyltransferase [Euryarchaeota archaeon]
MTSFKIDSTGTRPDLEPSSRLTETLSVVITAWRRQQFLAEALGSVLSDSGLPVEVVVVADFVNQDLERQVRGRGGKWILSHERGLGAMTAEGVRSASGSLIAFLDDDDLFDPHRLDYVRSVFYEDADLGFFHNGHIKFGHGDLPPFRSTTLGSPRLRIPPSRRTESDCESIWTDGAGYNGSSIVMRRTVLEPHLRELAEIRRGVPPYLFYRAWCSPTALVMDSLPLTAVRMHDSNMTPTLFQGRRARFRRLASIGIDLSVDAERILGFLPHDCWSVPLRQMSSMGEILAVATDAERSSRHLPSAALELIRRRRIWLPRWPLISLALIGAIWPRGARILFKRLIWRGGENGIESS